MSVYVSQLSSIHWTWWPHKVGVMMGKRETDEGETGRRLHARRKHVRKEL